MNRQINDVQHHRPLNKAYGSGAGLVADTRSYGASYEYPNNYRYYYGSDPRNFGPNWSGKFLVRKGEKAPNGVNNVIYEKDIQLPYEIVLLGDPVPAGYSGNRLIIFIDANWIIESVVQG